MPRKRKRHHSRDRLSGGIREKRRRVDSEENLPITSKVASSRRYKKTRSDAKRRRHDSDGSSRVSKESTEMNPPSSTLQDEATTTSTTIENPMRRIPKHNVTLFGAYSDLTDQNLPTELDILSERDKKEQKMFSYKSFTTQAANKLIGIWEKLGVKIMPKNSVLIKLNILLNKYQAEGKQRYYKPFIEFVKSLKKYFYIGKCKSDLKASVCTCGFIPERFREFKHDQHSQRRLTVDAFVMKNEEQGPTVMSSTPKMHSGDSTCVPPSVEEDMNINNGSQYVERHDCLFDSNITLICDRFGVSDRVASALGTALFQYIEIKDRHGEPLIMDKSKVYKSRLEVLRKRLDACVFYESY